MLDKVRIVLVGTTHPGNIGAVARAMKNMCLQQLVLVSPKAFPSAEATARASGADDLLANAMLCETLDEALMGCGLVVGASARLRSVEWPQLDPRGCAGKIVEQCLDGATSALLFGRESSGSPMPSWIAATTWCISRPIQLSLRSTCRRRYRCSATNCIPLH